MQRGGCNFEFEDASSSSGKRSCYFFFLLFAFFFVAYFSPHVCVFFNVDFFFAQILYVCASLCNRVRLATTRPYVVVGVWARVSRVMSDVFYLFNNKNIQCGWSKYSLGTPLDVWTWVRSPTSSTSSSLFACYLRLLYLESFIFYLFFFFFDSHCILDQAAPGVT